MKPKAASAGGRPMRKFAGTTSPLEVWLFTFDLHNEIWNILL